MPSPRSSRTRWPIWRRAARWTSLRLKPIYRNYWLLRETNKKENTMNIQRHSPNRSFSRRSIAVLAIGLFLALTSACTSVNRLREAQDSFNQAAAGENALRFDTKASDAATGILSVRSGYASALMSLKALEANGKQQTQLRTDGL